MGKSKWLIVAFYDGGLPKPISVEGIIQADIIHYNGFSTKDLHDTPETCFMWIDINRVIPLNHTPREWLPADADKYVSLEVVPKINNEFIRTQEATYTDIALVLDRDLFVSKNAVDIYKIIAKHNYFRPSREPHHFVCCFGGAPGGMKSSNASANICNLAVRSCFACPKDIEICKHTCYWRLIGLILCAYPDPQRSSKWLPDRGIERALPRIYIH